MIIGVFGAIIGVYIWVAKHISNSKKHPCSEKLVYKDVCESERKRIDDCIEGAARLASQRFESLEKSIDELKQLLREK